MAYSLISTRVPEIISNRDAGNAKGRGKPPLPNVQGYFHGWRPAQISGYREPCV